MTTKRFFLWCVILAVACLIVSVLGYRDRDIESGFQTVIWALSIAWSAILLLLGIVFGVMGEDEYEEARDTESIFG